MQSFDNLVITYCQTSRVYNTKMFAFW